VFLHDLGIVCSLGAGKSSVLAGLLQDAWPQPSPWRDLGIPAFAVEAELPAVPEGLQRFDCRNNRLLLAALQQLRPTLEPLLAQMEPGRVGVVVGTSTSGIDEGEQAIDSLQRGAGLPERYHYRQQELGGAADFLAGCLGAAGPVLTVSTSCSSSANALASARRLLRLGVCDLVIVGGSDALCRTTLQGFSALGLISRGRCNPFSRNRDGITLGEGAALFVMSRESAPLAMLGVGAASEAYHISAPRPDGLGARAAMAAALADAGLEPGEIDYLNLHGTGTPQNDQMEARAVAGLFPKPPAASSTKAVTGHCLGAAGAIEAGICWLLLSDLNRDGRLPTQRWDGAPDPALPALNLAGLENRPAKPLQYCASNSFAFGGNNVCLAIGRT